MVVLELESLLSEFILALPLPTLGATAGGAVLFPLPAPALRVVAAALRVDFPTILAGMPAAPPAGTVFVGFKGDTGRTSIGLLGEGRIGDRGRVWEFAERGDRTWFIWIFARDVVRAGGAAAPRGRFLGFSMSSFSLSTEISSLKYISIAARSFRVCIPCALRCALG